MRGKIVSFFALILLLNCGCTDLMLHPDNIDYAPGFASSHIVKDGFVKSSSDVQIHFWLVPAQDSRRHALSKSKGLIVLAHGNGNNLTDHIWRSFWLAKAGYDLLIFDYRGHGRSTGVPEVAGSLKDVISVLDFSSALANERHQLVFFYGQSLGGTLLLKAVSQNPTRWNPAVVIAEDPFFSFKEIAMERMLHIGIPLPIALLGYVSFSDDSGLRTTELATISPIPVLLFCSLDDPVISPHHCQRVNQSLRQPKMLVMYGEPGHLQAMASAQAKSREILVRALEWASIGAFQANKFERNNFVVGAGNSH
jgi:alpha-beta hydrolase superfamily lysophospholipase